jgi:energy-coupling factor transport system permease protein
MNSFTWIIWLIATLGALSSTRNPLHLLLLLLILGLMLKMSKTSTKSGDSYLISFFPLVIAMVTMATVFNALVSHVGSTVLITIPGHVTLISGPITLEAVIYGATNGLVLSGIFIAFSIFNQSLSVKTIIRLIPKAFYPLALIISIAINFLPTIKRRIEEIRQAQAIRGNQVRRIKDYASLFLPLLVDSLERSMQLAEAMTARGFIPQNPQRVSIYHRPVIFGGLAIFVFGWIMQLIGGNRYAGTISLSGVIIILGWFWWISRSIPQSEYKRESWNLYDGIISGVVVLALCTYILPLPFIDRQILQYNPYPTLPLPDFDLIIGFASLGFLIPAFFQKRISA